MLLVAALLACADATSADRIAAGDDPSVRYLISDAATGGKAGFYFLKPLVSNPKFSGTLDAALLSQLEVRVCALPACSASIAVFSSSSSPALSLVSGTGYQLTWHTKANALDPSINYRVSVYAHTNASGAVRLGFADIDVVPNDKALKAVATDMIGLVKDAPLNVKFRVETGIRASVDVTPDPSAALVGGTQVFSATVLDLHDAPLSAAAITWSTSNAAVATIGSASGSSTTATAVAPGVTRIKATSGDVADSTMFTISSEAALTSRADFSPPFPGVHSYIIGLVQPGATHEVLLVTTAETYSSGNVASPGSALTLVKKYDFSPLSPLEESTVASNPSDPYVLVFVSVAAFSPSLITVSLIAPFPSTSTVIPGATDIGGAVAINSSGAAFVFVKDAGVGVQKFTSSTGTLALTVGAAGSGAGALGAGGRGMVAGADGVLYVLDADNHRVARFNQTSGSFISSFAVTGTTTKTAMALSETGRLYLSNGNGGGKIYNSVTGAILGTFASASGIADLSVPGSVPLGTESLLLDGRGYLYLYDPATGLHVFYDPASAPIIP